jgi:hypothetical protein
VSVRECVIRTGDVLACDVETLFNRQIHRRHRPHAPSSGPADARVSHDRNTCYAVFLPLERAGGMDHGSDGQVAQDLAQGRVLNIDEDALMVLESEYPSELSSAVAVAPAYEKVIVRHFAQRCANARRKIHSSR